MALALQQLINGLTLGAVYGLIAIGYTMVYGIIGMINFAHGDIYMVSAFIAVTVFTLLATFGISSIPLSLLLVLLVAVLFTSVYGWTVERIAYRPLRGSSRLAPLISAIGMSIFLQNMVQLTQGARVKPIAPVLVGGIDLLTIDGFTVRLAYSQILIVFVTVALMAGFTWLITKTSFGRQQRSCEQDRTMTALLGINVDRTISLTFMLGAALAAVAGVMVTVYYGVVDFFIGFRRRHQGLHRRRPRRHRLAAGGDARRPADRPDRSVLGRLPVGRIQGCGDLQHPDPGADVPSLRPARSS
jgi:branched-chain amino acid transport system permease protein